MKYAAGIEYDGSGFHGWQRQKDATRTVQKSLEEALSLVANHPVQVQCAGRTDAGVHSTAQVAHFESDAVRSERSWLLGCNTNLPDDMNVLWVKPVADDFNARFDATGRAYRYVILNRTSRSGLLRGRVTWTRRYLDAERMVLAAKSLLGEHDFTSYRAIACQAKSPVKTLRRFDVERRGDFIVIDVEANAFLHHMVRNLVGVLIAIGRKEQEVDWAVEVLNHRDRTKGGVTAPPDGLYFVRVDYPEKHQLPASMLPEFWG